MQAEITKQSIDFVNTSCIIKGMKWYDKAKRLMRDKRLQQADFIKPLNVKTRGAVGHYLSGRRHPSPEQMRAMAELLGCSLDDLMSDGEVDVIQLQINRVIRSAEKAMASSTHPFTEEERLSIYRAAFAAGLDLKITDDQLAQYLAMFVSKH